MKKNHLRLFILLITIGLFSVFLGACESKAETLPPYTFSEDADKGDIVLYVFWGEGCSHCEAARPWLAQIDHDYPELNIRSFEIWYSEKNAPLFDQLADHFNVPEGGRGTPTFFLGGQYWVGYSDLIQEQITAAVQKCLEEGCPDAGAGIMPGASEVGFVPGQNGSSNVIDIPLIGRVDLSGQSIWISTILIAFVDGVNPCSVWVLTMLLALTLRTGSRKKVATIGVIFLSVTALIYALFIAGLFSVLKLTSFLGWIQVVVALLALFFAVVNIKDYFWYKEGLSFTIADEKKPGIYQKMRRVMDASQSFWGLAGATIIMAAGVSLVEFSCTAGFPVLWTNLLVAQQTEAALFILLLVIYMLIYQLDEMVIFFSAVFTLKSSKLEEKHGRVLKLVGGVLMLVLAGVMLINPELMNNLSASLIVFGLSFILVGLVLLIHRKILPAFGIWIGTEAGGKKKKRKSYSRGH